MCVWGGRGEVEGGQRRDGRGHGKARRIMESHEKVEGRSLEVKGRTQLSQGEVRGRPEVPSPGALVHPSSVGSPAPAGTDKFTPTDTQWGSFILQHSLFFFFLGHLPKLEIF